MKHGRNQINCKMLLKKYEYYSFVNGTFFEKKNKKFAIKSCVYKPFSKTNLGVDSLEFLTEPRLCRLKVPLALLINATKNANTKKTTKEYTITARLLRRSLNSAGLFYAFYTINIYISQTLQLQRCYCFISLCFVLL